MKRAIVGVLAGAVIVLPLTSAAASPPAHAASPQAKVRHNSVLLATSGTSANDIWTVGYWEKADQSDRTSYVRHWDGHAWKTVASPYLSGGHFASVAAIAPDDAWAVGATGYELLNLVEHWDGTSWSQLSVPSAPGSYNRLTDVSFLSADYVLTVGFSNAGEDPAVPIRLLWNGTTWAQAPASLDGVNRIDALSPTEAWGVGATPEGTTLAKHWDGTRWHTVKTPNVNGNDALTGVEEISPTDVWATGQVTDGSSPAFFEHWDGIRWTIVDDDGLGMFAVATDISASSSNDVWVSGDDSSGGFLDHWDGSAWTEVTNPGGARGEADLSGVATFSSTDAWSVGTWYKCAGGQFCYHKRIIQHWDGQAWTAYGKP